MDQKKPKTEGERDLFETELDCPQMSARAPELDIFGQGLVIREAREWKLTGQGRRLLHMMAAIGPHLAVSTSNPALTDRTDRPITAVDKSA
jgi:hypothetical protein